MAAADAICALLAPHVEAVVHDLTQDRIVHIAGNFSRRNVGDPSLSEVGDLKPFAGDVIGPYLKSNWDGRALRSMSAVHRDEAGVARFLLCINLDLSAFAAVRKALDALLTEPAGLLQAEALFPSDWRESVNAALTEFLAERRATLRGLDIAAQETLIARLDARGHFAVRGAAPYLADRLGCSRATLYKRLAAARAKGMRNT
jgi:predicted transcriptional regulator YheO